MKRIARFLRAPLNQASIVAIGGTTWAAVQGTMSWQAGLPVVAGAIVALILPDNSVAKEDVEAVVADAIKAVADVRKDVK